MSESWLLARAELRPESRLTVEAGKRARHLAIAGIAWYAARLIALDRDVAYRDAHGRA